MESHRGFVSTCCCGPRFSLFVGRQLCTGHRAKSEHQVVFCHCTAKEQRSKHAYPPRDGRQTIPNIAESARIELIWIIVIPHGTGSVFAHADGPISARCFQWSLAS